MTRVLVISGWARPAQSLSSLATHLRNLNRSVDVSVVAVHDLSPGGHAPGPLSPYAAGLRERCRALQSPCVLVGWSMGGMVALETAAAADPPVAALVLLSSTPRFCAAPDFSAGTPLSTLRAFIHQLKEHPGPTLAAFLERVTSPHRESPERLHQLVNESLTFPVEGLVEGLTYLQRADLRPAAVRLSTPALCVHGSDDAVIPCQASLWLEDRLPRCRAGLIPNIGHDAPTRCPNRIAAVIHEFLGRLLEER